MLIINWCPIVEAFLFRLFCALLKIVLFMRGFGLPGLFEKWKGFDLEKDAPLVFIGDFETGIG